MPDVSVIIPTYNRKHLLTEAIHSCLAQQEVTTEIILIDDGSTDGTSKAMHKFPVRYVRQKRQGPQAARNLGLCLAKGEYIKFLDSDDLLEENSLTAQYDHLRQTKADLCYGQWQFCDEKGVPRDAMQGIRQEDILLSLIDDWWVPNFAYLFRREFLLERMCMGDESSIYLRDLDFILRVMSENPETTFVPVLTGFYRFHRGHQLSTVENATRRQVHSGILRAIKQHLENKTLHSLYIDTKSKTLDYLATVGC